jgi:N-acetylmuramoyl-L-alanine amidase
VNARDELARVAWREFVQYLRVGASCIARMGVTHASPLRVLAFGAGLLCLSSLAAGLVVRQKPIAFGALREQLTLEYIRQHYDGRASSTLIQPVMVVVHWTASGTLQAAWNAFNPETLSGRADIAGGGRLNVSAQFIVDRDGVAYQLMPETRMARHTIGLNRRAIGIENVGDDDLTDAQLEANALLIEVLAKRYGIRYVIGHLEYGRFRSSALWEERDGGYFTVKPDPGAEFMRRLRARLMRDGLKFKDRP